VSAQVRAELLKIRSTRTTIGIVLGMIALILLFSLLSGLLTKAPSLTSTEDQRGLLSVGSLAGVFSALAGIMLVTSEYRFGTIRPTFLFTPKRSRLRLRCELEKNVLERGACRHELVDRYTGREREITDLVAAHPMHE
jgi:hypothetical protein